MLTRTTLTAKPDMIEKKWYVIDAEGQTLGRLAAEAAAILRGKNKPYFSTNIDTGDYVIVINADKIKLTGRKLEQKRYYRHTGYPGGLRSISAGELLQTKPELVVEKAIKGMLPHNKLGRAQAKKLHVYAGPEHKQAAQKPEVYTLRG
ncbi:MAG: 50S ribosomal protein L13 [Eubacteriaceae bacterium]|nr:50S ribosomal protein L13 [Eubacteriaceae bacterium]MBQ1465970.1 50S ribosomal protein L13 [Eubacteriaceae bacterium]MBR2779814.1 50S ribosomal protein L13 [Eubacteriaceae bacterium]